MKKLAPVFVLLAGTLWGIIGVFTRHFNKIELEALDIGWIRVFFGLVTVGVYLGCKHPEFLKIRIKDVWCFIGTGVCSLFMMNLTYFSALEHTSMAVAGVLLYTAPIFVMLMSAVLFGEKITIRKIFALLMAFLGCIFVAGIGRDSQVPLLGFLYGLGAGVSYSLYSVFGRYAIKRGYGSWTMIFYTFLFALFAHSLTCDWKNMADVLQIGELPWMAGLGIVTAFLPYLFYSLGLEFMENSRASVLASIEPVVATVTGILWFQESLTVLAVLGIVLVLGAVVMLSLQRGERK